MTSQTRSAQQQGKADPGVLDALNHHLAIASDLRSQVKQAHWSVVGPNFIAIHRLFDEQAAILAAQVDLLAERMRALQAIPRGTIDEAVKESDLPKLEIRELFEEDAISAILDRFERYSETLTEAIEQCDSANDLTTQDLFIQVQQEADLQAYFLRSHLPGPDAGIGSRMQASQDGAQPNHRGGNGA